MPTPRALRGVGMGAFVVHRLVTAAANSGSSYSSAVGEATSSGPVGAGSNPQPATSKVRASAGLQGVARMRRLRVGVLLNAIYTLYSDSPRSSRHQLSGASACRVIRPTYEYRHSRVMMSDLRIGDPPQL